MLHLGFGCPHGHYFSPFSLVVPSTALQHQIHLRTIKYLAIFKKTVNTHHQDLWPLIIIIIITGAATTSF